MFESINSDSPTLEIVHEYVFKDKDNINELNIILLRVKNSKDEFQNLMKILDQFVKNPNDNLRKNSLKLMSLVMERVKNLNLSEFNTLIEFSFIKMKDVVCAPFAVKILYYFLSEHFVEIKSEDESNKLIIQILENFKIENFQIVSYYQETRYFCIKILNWMIEKFHDSKYFQNKAIEYLQIVLDGIENEKDPRNILSMFTLITNINKYTDRDIIKFYAKNYFEALEIYYPIEFTPPKNSPDKITPENLIDSLNECFASCELYLEYILEVIKEKISSSVLETKIQVLKTIRKINENYSIEVLKPNYITIINLILQQILNNEDEFLHVESILTFKEIIKKLCDDLKVKHEDLFTEQEKHIKKNIDKIFEKSEDLLFSFENAKNAFDAKDLIILLIEYADVLNLNFKERAFKICLKLINSYLENNKFYYLKNANAILFFILNKQNSNQFILENKNYIKNLLLNMMKKSSNISEETECIIDILTCFIVKTECTFNDQEVVDLFNKIFNTWRESDTSIENHLAICLNEIIIKYDGLNNITFVVKVIDSKLNNFSKNENFEIGDICKYLNLMKCYFRNKKMENEVLDFLFKTFLQIYKLLNELDIDINHFATENLETILNKISNVFLELFENFNLNFSIIQPFLENLLSIERKNRFVNKNVFKDVLLIMKKIIKNMSENETDNLFEICMSYVKNIIDHNSIINNDSNREDLLSLTLINFCLKIIKLILHKKLNSMDEIANENILQKLLIFAINTFNDLDKKFEINNSIIKIFKIISKNIGIGFYYLYIKKLIIDQTVLVQFDEFFNRIFQSVIKILCDNTNVTNEFNRSLVIITNVLNYSILIDSNKYIQSVQDLLSSIVKNSDTNVKNIFLDSNFFKFDKEIFGVSNQEKVYKMFGILKNLYQSSRDHHQSIFLYFLLNIYSKYNDNMLEESFDIILNLCIKALELEVNLKVASDLLKKMLKYMDKDFARKKGYNLKSLIENLIKVTYNVFILRL